MSTLELSAQKTAHLSTSGHLSIRPPPPPLLCPALSSRCFKEICRSLRAKRIHPAVHREPFFNRNVRPNTAQPTITGIASSVAINTKSVLARMDYCNLLTIIDGSASTVTRHIYIAPLASRRRIITTSSASTLTHVAKVAEP